jgi:hypothetical protein
MHGDRLAQFIKVGVDRGVTPFGSALRMIPAHAGDRYRDLYVNTM